MNKLNSKLRTLSGQLMAPGVFPKSSFRVAGFGPVPEEAKGLAAPNGPLRPRSRRMSVGAVCVLSLPRQTSLAQVSTPAASLGYQENQMALSGFRVAPWHTK